MMVLHLHPVLFGFWSNLASILERLALHHSYSYAPAANHSTFFASLPQKIQILLRNAG